MREASEINGIIGEVKEYWEEPFRFSDKSGMSICIVETAIKLTLAQGAMDLKYDKADQPIPKKVEADQQ